VSSTNPWNSLNLASRVALEERATTDLCSATHPVTPSPTCMRRLPAPWRAAPGRPATQLRWLRIDQVYQAGVAGRGLHGEPDYFAQHLVERQFRADDLAHLVQHGTSEGCSWAGFFVAIL